MVWGWRYRIAVSDVNGGGGSGEASRGLNDGDSGWPQVVVVGSKYRW